MKTLVLLSCLLGPALAHGQESPDPAWMKFDSKIARFSAEFPTKPNAKTRMPFGQFGTLRTEVVVAEPTGGPRFQVLAEDLPVVPNLPSPRTRLKGMHDGVIGPDAKVLADEEITLGEQKIPGYALLMEKDGKHQRFRLFLYGDRWYEVSVIGTKEEVTSKEADRFLDSFEFVK